MHGEALCLPSVGAEGISCLRLSFSPGTHGTRFSLDKLTLDELREKSGDANQAVLLMISLGASIPISLLCERLWKKIEEREDAVVLLLPPSLLQKALTVSM
jgi:hypothetical protein